MDYVVQVDKLPLPGETVLSREFIINPGGKGANQAYALGKIGANVVMLGAIGEDNNGEQLKNNLMNVGVDVSRLKVCKDNTGIAIINIDNKAENNIVVVQGANLYVTPDYIEQNEDIIKESEFIILQLEIPIESVIHAIRIAKSYGKTVILDPAPAPKNLSYDVFKDILSYVDILKPNESELEILSGIDCSDSSYNLACKKILDMGMKGCIVTSLGEKGVLLAKSDSEFINFEAKKVKAIDTTAAGDSFTAALTFALSKGLSIDIAINLAIEISAIVVTRKGAQASFPTKLEIKELTEKYHINL